MMGMSIGVFTLVFLGNLLALMPSSEADTLQNPAALLWFLSFIACIVGIGLYCFISSYEINRRWRKIVEDDMTQPIDLETLERSSLSLRSLRKFLYCSLAMPFIALLLTVPTTMIVIELFTPLRWWNCFEYTRYLPQSESFAVVVFLSFVIIPTLFIFTYVVGMKITNENSLTAWQPKIPNYLQVLTGEEQPQRGFRYRTNFWSDLLLVGVGLCILQTLFCEKYFHSITAELGNQHYYVPVFVISFIAYLLFAMFFAGIPRKRYFGYIYLGTFIAVLNTVFALFIDPWHDIGGRLVMLVIVLFWLSCFILSGVLGLYAFRKR